MRSTLFSALLFLPLLAGCDSSDPNFDTPPPPSVDNPSIVELVVGADDLTTLEAAVTQAGLVGALSSDGPFTVFAPTDAAFAQLLSDLGVTAAELLARENLADILQLHVLDSEVLSSALADGATVTTLNGQMLTVRAVDGGFGLDTEDEGDEIDARIIDADLRAENGVVHKLDAVLLPAMDTAAPTITELVVSSDDLTTLEAAVLETGLDAALAGPGPFTVFAPTDDAFGALLDELGVTAAELLAREDLADILQLHVLDSEVLSSALADGATVTTLNGQMLTVRAVDGGFGLDTDDVGDEPEALIRTVDVDASNGVVHLIDAVLLPAETSTITELVVASEDLTTLEAAVIQAGLDGTLSGDGPFTVFAPTDDAFDDLLDELGVTAAELLAREDLADILTLHVIAGSAIMSGSLADGAVVQTENGQMLTVRAVDGGFGLDTEDADDDVDARITTVDIPAANGVVHLIDAVMLPAPTASITALVVESSGLTTLEAAVVQAGFDSALDSDGPFTVFAPTDAAFSAVIEALGTTAEELLAREDLGDILRLHVVAGPPIFSGDLADGAQVTTLSGQSLTVVAVDGGFGLDTQDAGLEADARIETADIEASNGVVHLIDWVLLP